MLTKIKQTTDFIRRNVNINPEVGIILGSGLGSFVDSINIIKSFDYKEIPNFAVSTVEGHNGKLILGDIGGKKIVVMQGRFHYYEGYNLNEITFPVRVMKMLGIHHLFVSNASGGINPSFEIGDLMVITDHINLFPENPLRGANIDEFGTRFPDMSEAYNKSLIKKAEEVAAENNIKIKKGIYAGMTGPTFETPAEYTFARVSGADSVGMSTVPEVIIARHMKLPVFGVSIITDIDIPGNPVIISHEEVQKVAQKAGADLEVIFTKLIGKI